MAINSKSVIAPLSDTEVLTAVKPAVTLYNSSGSPIPPPPAPYSQPSEVQAAYDYFKGVTDAASPNDSKQVVKERIGKRRVFDDEMGNFLDLVMLGARKDPSLLVQFGITFLGQPKAKSASKMAQLLAFPHLVLQAIDKDPGSLRCKVRGGVKKGVEIYNAYDDPTNESNWSRLDSFVNGSFTLTGLSSGRRAYIRGRFIYSQGKKGPWSEIVHIMVP